VTVGEEFAFDTFGSGLSATPPKRKNVSFVPADWASMRPDPAQSGSSFQPALRLARSMAKALEEAAVASGRSVPPATMTLLPTSAPVA